jgi:hypothetical protein
VDLPRPVGKTILLEVFQELGDDLVADLRRCDPIRPAIAGETGQAEAEMAIVEVLVEALPRRFERLPVSSGDIDQADPLQG